MSSKKRKSVSPWSACDHCNVIIAQKDGEIHKESNCPPNFRTWSHPFIFQESLYTTFGCFQADDKNLELISRENKNEFALMPCHVLELCKIPVGDSVLFRIDGCEKPTHIVKKAWPKECKTSDFNLEFSDEVAELYEVSPKSQVIVSKIKEKLIPAKSVTLVCLKNIQPNERKDLLSRLQQQNINKAYYVGNKLLLRHYGRKVIFEIVEMTSSTEFEDKIDGFGFITTETLWKLSGVEEKKQKRGNYKLGGMNSTLEEVKEVITLALNEENFIPGVYINRGVLIHGPPGTGKTVLLETLADLFSENVVRVECTKIFSKFVGETEKELENLFEKAKQMSPSIILIDDLHVLCTKSNSVTDFEKRIVATLSVEMDRLNFESSALVIVIAATSKIHQIDKMLRNPSRFGKEIEIYVPGSSQRFEILSLLLENVNHSLSDLDIKSVADSSHGFVGADLLSLVSKAVFKNYKISQGEEKVSVDDFQWALNKIKPSALREIMIDIPNVRWDDVGGQEDLKLKLKQCIEWPIKYRESFTRLGISPPKGVLMFGPPGCSKTMIAKAVATESRLNFISVKGPELFSKWVGESERAVRKVFRRARQTAPSIIFFDELDAIGGERSNSSSSNVQERVLAQLLMELDGVETLDNVTVIAATNRLDRIDPALMRPGRLDRIIYVPLPDRHTRQEIFRLQFSKTSIADDVILDELVEKTEGYSGAEIVALSREAALKALEEDFNATVVTRKHFLSAFSIVLPRTPKSLLELYDKYLLK